MCVSVCVFARYEVIEYYILNTGSSITEPLCLVVCNVTQIYYHPFRFNQIDRLVPYVPNNKQLKLFSLFVLRVQVHKLYYI